MTPAERLAELIRHGATIKIMDPAVTLTLAGALWQTHPTRLRWCAIFPEHQGHIHETRFDRNEFNAGGRDIGFYRGDQMVAYVCPYEESGLDFDEVREALSRWRAVLVAHGNVADFTEFLAEA